MITHMSDLPFKIHFHHFIFNSSYYCVNPRTQSINLLYRRIPGILASLNQNDDPSTKTYYLKLNQNP